MLRRGALVDVWTDGTRTAVFVTDQVLVLSEVASAILAAVPERGSASLADIVAAVIRRLGVPEPPLDAATIVQQQVDDLVAHEVLVRMQATP